MGLAREEGSSDAVFPITLEIIRQMDSYMKKDASSDNWGFIQTLQHIGEVAVKQVSGFEKEHALFSAKNPTEVSKLLSEFPEHLKQLSV